MRLLLLSLGAALFVSCGTTSSACGANACGACPSGCTAADSCVNGKWECACSCPDAGNCGPNPCGACPTGCTPVDECRPTGWSCQCACP